MPEPDALEEPIEIIVEVEDDVAAQTESEEFPAPDSGFDEPGPDTYVPELETSRFTRIKNHNRAL